MTLFTFGDSWTEGVGADLEEELKTNVFENSVTAEIIELKHQVESFYKKLL